MWSDTPSARRTGAETTSDSPTTEAPDSCQVNSHAIARAIGGNLRADRGPLLVVSDDIAEPQPSRVELVALLYHRQYRDLVRLAYGLLGDRAEAEEVAQDAFAVLLSRWSSLRNVESAPGYLRTTVVNGARGHWRRRRVRELADKTLRRDPASKDRDVVEESAVLAAVGQLPLRKRECVLLRYYADLSEAETAAALGISVGTVKSQTSKALSQLAALLEPAQSEVNK
jgi:RNA polymerase sigma-70 factor (sigma-E family)